MTVQLAYNGHSTECMCVPCMMAELDDAIVARGGEEALNRINNEMVLINGGKAEAERTRFLKPGQGAGIGKRGTRRITEGQRKYIVSLIQSRDISKIRTYPGQTLVIENVGDMGIPAASALIEALRDAPVVSARMATEGQKKFIRSLNNDIQDVRCRISESDIQSITFAEVNDTLALLKRIIAAEKEETANAVSTKPERTEVTVGAYWYTHNGERLIARVQKAQRGHLYATLQIDTDSNEFDMRVRGLIYKLNANDMLTLADMKAFGNKYMQCADCGRKLTNKISVARGIGPVCSGKGYSEI